MPGKQCLQGGLGSGGGAVTAGTKDLLPKPLVRCVHWKLEAGGTASRPPEERDSAASNTCLPGSFQ